MQPPASNRRDSHRYLRLERRYLDLKAKVRELDGQVSLTPEEQLQVVVLKRRKLALKDALNEFAD
ncbi:MAG: YdcH family protein [Myxococcales bacterium]|nr:YdcH family protein [Myxococcales bacterium]MDD9965015.1 YdcH family protein [Myxococcales bacterium]